MDKQQQALEEAKKLAILTPVFSFGICAITLILAGKAVRWSPKQKAGITIAVTAALSMASAGFYFGVRHAYSVK